MFASAFSSAFSGGVGLPLEWACVALPDGKVGTLLAQVGLLRGESATRAEDGRLVIGERDLVGPAGKVYSFASPESAAIWAGIVEDRGRRELALSREMSLTARAAWLARKRRQLEFDAAHRVERAQRIADADIRGALIADSTFALIKWAHCG